VQTRVPAGSDVWPEAIVIGTIGVGQGCSSQNRLMSLRGKSGHAPLHLRVPFTIPSVG
jgi:hypothetical protein